MGKRSIVESINHSIKKKHIVALNSKKTVMKKREFGWHMIVYNLNKVVKRGDNCVQKKISFYFLIVWKRSFLTEPI